MGINFYQRLKHQVLDKVHARNIGNKTLLTRQPVEGKRVNGGLRVGEMEKDSFLSHASAAILKDRLLYNSDYYKHYLCSKCGVQCIPPNPPKKTKAFCTVCKSTSHCKSLAIPFAFKLLLQELLSMHCFSRIRC